MQMSYMKIREKMTKMMQGQVWSKKGGCITNTNKNVITDVNTNAITNTGCFCDWCLPKKLKYGKPRLGEYMLT